MRSLPTGFRGGTLTNSSTLKPPAIRVTHSPAREDVAFASRAHVFRFALTGSFLAVCCMAFLAFLATACGGDGSSATAVSGSHDGTAVSDAQGAAAPMAVPATSTVVPGGACAPTNVRVEVSPELLQCGCSTSGNLDCVRGARGTLLPACAPGSNPLGETPCDAEALSGCLLPNPEGGTMSCGCGPFGGWVCL